MTLPIDLVKDFENIKQHTDVADIQRMCKLKSYSHAFMILKGKNGTTLDNILLIKDFIEKRKDKLNQLNNLYEKK